MNKSILIEWDHNQAAGTVDVFNGKLASLTIKGNGKVEKNNFKFSARESCRLKISISDAMLDAGPDSTIVTVNTKKNPFSFFLRDVCKEYPIYIPAYGVTVTEADDSRSYRDIENAIKSKKLLTAVQHIDLELEETYENAVKYSRRMNDCPTWLGISRDMRIFRFDFQGNLGSTVTPYFHNNRVFIPEGKDTAINYTFSMGRGCGCVRDASRHLEDGALPILKGKYKDDDITYITTAFATHESGILDIENVIGTHFLVADAHSHGHIFTEEQMKQIERLLPAEMSRNDELVLCCRIEAINTSMVPRYAWFKGITPDQEDAFKVSYEKNSGFSKYDSGRVFCISRLNGKPAPDTEFSILIKPGESAVYELFIPHRPITGERAESFAQINFDTMLDACRKFWNRKLEACAQVRLPEKVVDEMVRAGLLHLDLITYGLEPEGTVAPCIGYYPPIASESAPIIQFLDSMGCHDLAKRSLMYFLDKQHEEGLIQNVRGYMLETQAALWSIGEHFRITHDIEWIKQIKPKLMKSIEYILKWIERNKIDELKGICYGMIDGKVADPEDPFHVFMLNGYTYLALDRMSEMLAEIDQEESVKMKNAALELKKHIRTAFFKSMSKSPVVPLGDGSWCPTAPPWPEYIGPFALYAQGDQCWTHGSFLVRDSVLGPLWLVYQEVLEPSEPSVDLLMHYHCDLMHSRNVAFMQPYYSPHPWIHLKRREVKQFLKTYYNEFVSLADRETYSFWECYYYASPHKTHEEGWFLMRTRWMLYMEEGKTLNLLQGVPRSWLENGKTIELKNAASYFGKFSIKVTSVLDCGYITAIIECPSERKPEKIEIRLPHPDGKKAISATGGIYNTRYETVMIDRFNGYAEITVSY